MRARDADIEQPPFFVQRAFDLGAVVREDTFLQPDEVTVRKLQAFRGVQRDEHDAGPRLFVLVVLLFFLAQRHRVEVAAQPFGGSFFKPLKPFDHVAHAALALEGFVGGLARSAQFRVVIRLVDD